MPNSKRIRELREGRSWPQQQLADVADVSLRTVQRIESGKSATQETLSAIASALDVEVSTLLEDPEPISAPPKVIVLRRIESGERLCNVVGGAHLYQEQYDPPNDQEEVELLGSFLQEAHDIGTAGTMWSRCTESNGHTMSGSRSSPSRVPVSACSAGE
jgi:transcriptional regulator with XRE-family HTH domain